MKSKQNDLENFIVDFENFSLHFSCLIFENFEMFATNLYVNDVESHGRVYSTL